MGDVTRKDERGNLTPLEDLIAKYAWEFLGVLRAKYARFEKLSDCEERPESCKHVYAGTSYGDGVICTPCATHSTVWQDATRMARAQIDTDRRDLSAWMLKIARQDTVLLFTPAELKMLASLANELEKPRCV